MCGHIYKPSIASCAVSVSIEENGNVMTEDEGLKRILCISPRKVFLGLRLIRYV